MNIQKATLSIGSCLLLTGLGLPVYAQTPANSFEEMRAMPQVRIGEKVEVTDETGKKFKAAINGISDNSLDVTVHGIRRELWESQVSRIRRTGTHVGSGAKAGVVGGAIFGAVVAAAACGSDHYYCGYYFGVLVPAWAGVGTGVGALVGLAIPHHETVFSQPGGLSGRRISISPILAKGKMGAQLSVSF